MHTFLNAEKRPFFCLVCPLTLFGVVLFVLRAIVDMATAVEDDSMGLLGEGRGGGMLFPSWGPWNEEAFWLDMGNTTA